MQASLLQPQVDLAKSLNSSNGPRMHLDDWFSQVLTTSFLYLNPTDIKHCRFAYKTEN